MFSKIFHVEIQQIFIIDVTSTHSSFVLFFGNQINKKSK